MSGRLKKLSTYINILIESGIGGRLWVVYAEFSAR